MDVSKISKPNNEYAILILAAGSSRRMGRSKQLLTIDGTSLLAKTVQSGLDTRLSHVVVVLGANEAAHKQEIQKFPIKIVSNKNREKGLGSSIKKGIQFITENYNPNGVVILVCDQPHLSAQHISNLIDKHKNTDTLIVASAYANTIGVPTLFDKVLLKDLLNLDDSHGARKILDHHAKDVVTIPFPNGEIDLDTMEDYNKWIP